MTQENSHGTTARCSKLWRYDYDWLVARYEEGWSCMDLAHYDSCSPGTIEYHLEQAGVEVDSWGPLCPRFQAEKAQDRRTDGIRYRHAIEPDTGDQVGLEDLL